MTTPAGSPLQLLARLSPAVPVGAFASSHGLESAVDAGLVRDASRPARRPPGFDRRFPKLDVPLTESGGDNHAATFSIDLAPHVGASLDGMERDTERMRGGKPGVFSDMKSRAGVETVIDFIRRKGGLGARRAANPL